MKKHLLAIALLALAASPALAQTAEKHAPAGASAAMGEPPEAVKTYVTSHPSDALPYSGKVSVGHPIDGDQIWMQIPEAPAYRWTNLNGQKVVVDKKSGHVVAVY